MGVLQSTSVYEFIDRKFTKTASTGPEAKLEVEHEHEHELSDDQEESSDNQEKKAREEVAKEIYEKEKRMLDRILKTEKTTCRDPEPKLCSKELEMTIQDSI